MILMSKKPLPYPRSSTFTSMLFTKSSSSYVSHTVNLLPIIFFYMVWGRGQISFFFMWISGSAGTICWKHYSSLVIYLVIFKKSIDHKCQFVFWDFSFILFIYMCNRMLVPQTWLLYFCSQFWNWAHIVGTSV